MHLKKIKNSRGDTIVEVLIASAVIGLMLTGSYITINSSLKNSRQAREHSEALKIAESQIEGLRSMAGDTALFTGAPQYFCIYLDGTNTPVRQAITSPATYSRGNFSGYPANCQKASLGSFMYNTSIYTEASNLNRFFVNVDWYGPTGKVESINLIYALYPS